MFDVVVIGAGPAGSMTAFHAARGGMRVLLVDRAPIGRSKACGDALSPNAVAAVRAMGVGDPDWHIVRGLHIHTDHRGCGTELFSEHTAPHFGATIERRHFDAWLVQRAIDAGAEFMNGEVTELGYTAAGGTVAGLTGTGLTEERVSSVSIRGAGGSGGTNATVRVAADHVVLATGAAVPRFAKSLFSRTTPMRYAAAGRGYVEIAAGDGGTGAGRDFLHAVLPIDAGGAALLGYAWAFPISETRLNVGVGVLRDATHRRISLAGLIQPAVERLGRHMGVSIDPAAIRDLQSAPLMLGPAIGGPAGVLAVGDIAGLTHPISGEGIAAALESGELAARSMLASGASNYWAALGRKKRRLYAGALRIQAIVARPAFAVQRGADIITRADRFAGRALRRFMWELPDTASQHQQHGDAASGDAVSADTAFADAAFVDAVATMLVDGIAETAPGVAVLVQELIDSRDSEFGWLARFYASACRDIDLACYDLAGNDFAGDDKDVLAAALAEATTLSQFLGADLAGRSDDPHLHGSNALALLAIDALTAFVMDRVARADERVARLVLSHSRAQLEAEATLAARDAATSAPLNWVLVAKLVSIRTDDADVHARLLDAASDFERPLLAAAVNAAAVNTVPVSVTAANVTRNAGPHRNLRSLPVPAWPGQHLQALRGYYRHRQTCGS